ncbi:MAG: hypothetical protein AAF614_34620 [Chloroflexota bacterium]
MSKQERVETAVSWQKRAAIWIGIGINPASITLGGGLAAELPFRLFLPVMFIGASLLSLICIAQGLLSRRYGHTVGKQANHIFGGTTGASLLNLLMALGMIGWGGFHIGISGASVADLFQLPGWIGTLIIATAVFILSNMGVTRWNALMWLTTIAALALAISALIITDARPVWDSNPEPVPFSLILWSIATVFTYAILFALRSADFSWNVARDRDIHISGLLFFVSYVVGMLVGAILYQTTGDWNLADVLSNAQSASLGHIFLIVAVASPALSSLHSGSLAITSITPIKDSRLAILIICLITFALGATRFDRQLIPFLDVISTVLPPVLFIILAILWWQPKTKAQTALTAWLVGAAVAVLLKFLGANIHMPVGALVSLATLFLLNRRH